MLNKTVKLYAVNEDGTVDRSKTEKVALCSPSWAVFDEVFQRHGIDITGIAEADVPQDELHIVMIAFAGRLLPAMLRDSSPALSDMPDATLIRRMVAGEIDDYADAMLALCVDARGGNRPNPVTAAKP